MKIAYWVFVCVYWSAFFGLIFIAGWKIAALVFVMIGASSASNEAFRMIGK